MGKMKGARLTGSHDDGRDDHQFAVVAAEDAKEPEHDAGTGQDAEADGDTADADAGGVVAVDVEGLCGPEHDDGEEVGAGDEGNDQRQGQNARLLLQAGRKHGEFGKLDFPDGEEDEGCRSKE